MLCHCFVRRLSSGTPGCVQQHMPHMTSATFWDLFGHHTNPCHLTLIRALAFFKGPFIKDVRMEGERGVGPKADI